MDATQNKSRPAQAVIGQVKTRGKIREVPAEWRGACMSWREGRFVFRFETPGPDRKRRRGATDHWLSVDLPTAQRMARRVLQELGGEAEIRADERAKIVATLRRHGGRVITARMVDAIEKGAEWEDSFGRDLD